MTELEEVKPEVKPEQLDESKKSLKGVDKPKKTWTCPDCGNTYTYKYKYSHASFCKGKPEPQLLSNLIPEATLKETAPIKEEVEPDLPYVDDKRLNFYLQIAIVISVVMTALYVVYKAIMNQPQQSITQQPIDQGYTDSRGVYYSPFEFSHERGW